MHVQGAPFDATWVWKIASIEFEESIANRLLVASGVSGAGASAISKALVNIKTPTSEAKTTTLRCAFFTPVPTFKVRFVWLALSNNTARDSSDDSSVKGQSSLQEFSKISMGREFTTFTGRTLPGKFRGSAELPHFGRSPGRLFELVLRERLEPPAGSLRDRLQ